MAKRPVFRVLFLVVFFAAVIVQDGTGSRIGVGLHNNPTEDSISSTERELNLKNNQQRTLIGSVAPTCTYNECRGCKYRCRAEQVPVEGNDPINSPYHYKCVCHR